MKNLKRLLPLVPIVLVVLILTLTRGDMTMLLMLVVISLALLFNLLTTKKGTGIKANGYLREIKRESGQIFLTIEFRTREGKDIAGIIAYPDDQLPGYLVRPNTNVPVEYEPGDPERFMLSEDVFFSKLVLWGILVICVFSIIIKLVKMI